MLRLGKKNVLFNLERLHCLLLLVHVVVNKGSFLFTSFLSRVLEILWSFVRLFASTIRVEMEFCYFPPENTGPHFFSSRLAFLCARPGDVRLLDPELLLFL